MKDPELRLLEWVKKYHANNYSRYDSFRILGRYFGYPDCCIDNFVELIKLGFAPAVYTEWLYGKKTTKHVQCPKCIGREINKRGISYEDFFRKWMGIN